MLMAMVLLGLGLPAFVAGYRAYRSGRRFRWLRQAWLALLLVALAAYLAWGSIDAMLRAASGGATGAAFDGLASAFLCLVLPCVAGPGLIAGFLVAVIRRSIEDKDWGRLRDGFR